MPGRKRETGHQMQQEFSQVRAFALTGSSTAQQTTLILGLKKLKQYNRAVMTCYGPIPLIAANKKAFHQKW